MDENDNDVWNYKAVKKLRLQKRCSKSTGEQCESAKIYKQSKCEQEVPHIQQCSIENVNSNEILENLNERKDIEIASSSLICNSQQKCRDIINEPSVPIKSEPLFNPAACNTSPFFIKLEQSQEQPSGSLPTPEKCRFGRSATKESICLPFSTKHSVETFVNNNIIKTSLEHVKKKLKLESPDDLSYVSSECNNLYNTQRHNEENQCHNESQNNNFSFVNGVIVIQPEIKTEQNLCNTALPIDCKSYLNTNSTLHNSKNEITKKLEENELLPSLNFKDGFLISTLLATNSSDAQKYQNDIDLFTNDDLTDEDLFSLPETNVQITKNKLPLIYSTDYALSKHLQPSPDQKLTNVGKNINTQKSPGKTASPNQKYSRKQRSTPKKSVDCKQPLIKLFFKSSATDSNLLTDEQNIGSNDTCKSYKSSCVKSTQQENCDKKIMPSLSTTISSVSKQQENCDNKIMPSLSTTISSVSKQQPTERIPYYKNVQGTRFTVDAFNYGTIPGCVAYFLSHFHYDHYCGLNKRFAHKLYCSKVTANLVRKKLYVSPDCIHALPLNEPTVVDNTEVTLIEANHCPGSVMILFKTKTGRVILHTGDFRAHSNMETNSVLIQDRINLLYLDTTYSNPTYIFPLQQEVISFAVKKSLEFVETHSRGIVLVGTYTIGKERIFLAIAEALNSKIFVQRDKKIVLECLEDPAISSRITRNPTEAKVHIVNMGCLSYQKLSAYVNEHPSCNKLLAFEPTGWTQAKIDSLASIKPKINSRLVTLYGVPYSEHSSYLEMKRFVQYLQPDKVIPTVPARGWKENQRLIGVINSWLSEKQASPSKVFKQSTLSPQSWKKAKCNDDIQARK